MGKRFDANAARLRVLSSFGKDLNRRAKSKCEMCGAANTNLSIYEIPPVDEVPEYENCLFLCDECLEQIEKPKYMKPDYWRLLNHSLWSEIPVVQVLSIVMLKRLAPTQPWAEELLEQAYPSAEIQAWVDLVP